jgi:hypothetical protein
MDKELPPPMDDDFPKNRTPRESLEQTLAKIIQAEDQGDLSKAETEGAKMILRKILKRDDFFKGLKDPKKIDIEAESFQTKLIQEDSFSRTRTDIKTSRREEFHFSKKLQ